MDPLDAVLALLVRNTEVLAGMTHAHPSKATISLEQSDTREENQENDFTRLSTIPNPRRRKEANVRVKAMKVGQKAREKVEDNEEKKGEAREGDDTREDGEGRKKKEKKGEEEKGGEGEEDKVSKLVKRQNRKALKKGEKEKKKEKKMDGEQQQNMMHKDGYTLLEPGLNAWVAINDMDQDQLWEEIFPAVR
jgi:hypothetical protein